MSNTNTPREKRAKIEATLIVSENDKMISYQTELYYHESALQELREERDRYKAIIKDAISSPEAELRKENQSLQAKVRHLEKMISYIPPH